MPPAGVKNPYPGFAFVVEIDGIATAAFREVAGLEGSVDVIEYREGADPLLSARKLPGLVKYANVLLKRGLTDSRELYDWWRSVAEGKPDRRNVAIVLLDRERNAVRRWLLRDAWPVRYAVAAFDAQQNEIAVETLELAHEGFELD